MVTFSVGSIAIVRILLSKTAVFELWMEGIPYKMLSVSINQCW
jgi:hypothetical protein